MNPKILLIFTIVSFSLIFSYPNLVFADSILVENFEVEYEIDFGNVKSMTLDPDFLELIVNIESTDDGILQISIPRSLLDANFEQEDDTFIIFADGFPTEYIEITDREETRTILIPFFFGDSEIEIIGTTVLDEEIGDFVSESEVGNDESDILDDFLNEIIEEETIIEIPSWIKNNARWWADNQIDDATFVQGIQYLIQNDIMTIPPTQSGSSSSQEIPSWVQNNADWWAQDLISDTDFVSGIQFLITNGIMKI